MGKNSEPNPLTSNFLEVFDILIMTDFVLSMFSKENETNVTCTYTLTYSDIMTHIH